MNTKQIYPILETMLWELFFFFFLSAIKKAFQKKTVTAILVTLSF